MAEITAEEAANGWTEESLAKYRLERERAQSGIIYFHPDHRPVPRKPFANNRYRVLKWR